MNRLIVIFVFILILFSGCSKITPKYDVTFEIRKPDALQMMNISEEFISSFENTIESITTGNTMAEPIALTELTCVGVLVGYTTAPRLGTCIFNSGAEVAVGQFGGLVPYNGSGASEIRVEDLIGDQQLDVYAVGFKTSNSTCAKLIPGVDPKEGTGAEYSEPYVLGAISGFLAGGKNNFFPEISANFNSNYRVDDCRGPLFNKDSVLRDGLVAFWNFENDNANITSDSTSAYSLDFSGAAITNSDGLKSSRALHLATDVKYAHVTSNDEKFSVEGHSLSLSFWLKAIGTQAVSTDNILFRKVTTSGDDLTVELSNCSSGTNCILAAKVNGTLVTSSCTGLNLTTLNHFAIVFQRTATAGHVTKIYNNAAATACGVQTDNNVGAGSSSAFKIGDSLGTGAGSNDIFIDSLGVWQRPLRDFEIKALYNNGLGKEYPFE
ncbi:MAG: hypothetical protein KA116_12550 [Proteobacteria bacterium]|nr:hypothetical protein [Pseudomonadota bacterium]